MTIQSFIKKAIEGGWNGGKVPSYCMDCGDTEAGILLDPLAWKAVGKLEGWTNYRTYENYVALSMQLWDGVSIEQYLETL